MYRESDAISSDMLISSTAFSGKDVDERFEDVSGDYKGNMYAYKYADIYYVITNENVTKYVRSNSPEIVWLHGNARPECFM